MAYKTLDDIDNNVVVDELEHYFGGIINEIVQVENGGYFSRRTIQNQLDRIMSLLDNQYTFDD